MSDIDQLTAAINRLADLLTLGPKTRRWMYIYMGQEFERSCWYHRPEGENVPCGFDSLVGFLEMVDFEEREYKGKMNLKVKFVLVADRPYHLQTGADTAFAKIMYAAIAAASPEELCRPIEVAPYPGDENTVFANITSNGKLLRLEQLPDWKNGDWNSLRLAAQSKVETAMKARGLPSRLRDRQDSPPQSEPSSPQPTQEPTAFRRLKDTKEMVGVDNNQVWDAIREANPEAARLDNIKEAIALLDRPEATTTICNLLWWWGLTFREEEDLKHLYNAMFTSLETESERKGIQEYVRAVRQGAAKQPAMADSIPY